MSKKETAIDYIASIEKRLSSLYNDPTLCRQYAWWILQEIVGQKKEQLIIKESLILTEKQEKKLEEWLDKLINEKMPLQYLIGSVPFNDIELFIKSPVLIPRPETEEWILDLIDKLKKLPKQELLILDIGTGSGVIALALAHALPQAHIYAVDISDEALSLAQKNANHNNIQNVTFIKSDIYNAIASELRFDLIVSNPPYITHEEYTELEESVARWEDKRALVADNMGLAIIITIIEKACQYMKKNNDIEKAYMGNLYIEIGYKQADVVSELMRKYNFVDIKVHKDLQRKDRVVSGRVDSCGHCRDIKKSMSP